MNHQGATFKTNIHQREQLLNKEYILQSNAIPTNILNHWKNLAKQLEANALEAHKNSEPFYGACVIKNPTGPLLMSTGNILEIDPDAVY